MNGHRGTSRLQIALRYGPGFLVLIYAYLYLVGYSYLSSYFEKWRLNSIEMGFSIVDYATVAILPLYNILLFLAVSAGLGNLIATSKRLFAKRPRLKIVTLSIVAVAWLAWLLFQLIKLKSSIIDFSLLCTLIELPVFCGSYLYYSLGHEPLGRNKFIIYSMALLLVIIPVLSGIFGEYNAHTYRAYSSNPLRFPRALSRVIVYARSPIENFDLFCTEDNKYENLFLLALKDGTYFFVADIRKVDALNAKVSAQGDNVEKLLKEAEIPKKELSILLDDQGLSGVDLSIKSIGSKIGGIEKAILSSDERVRILGALKKELEHIDSRLSQATIKNKQAEGLINKIRKDMDKVHIEIAKLRRLASLFSSLKEKTFAIRKEDISQIVYLEDDRREIKSAEATKTK